MSIQQHNPNNAPFSLIKYEAEIQTTDNMQQYQKSKNQQKVLDPRPSPQDVLNNMILPRQWQSNEEKYFMQYVSHQKAQRDDVVHLKEELDKALQYRQARAEGICSVRQQLFSQGFNQIIRQVAINCPERGLLLMRIRDEHIMSLAAYQTLYQSSVTYGIRKLLQSQQGMDQLKNELKYSQQIKDQNQNTKKQLILKKQFLQKKLFQRKRIEKQNREDDILQIQDQQTSLNKFLSSLKDGNKAQ